jgi:hypothetical protein
MTVSEAFGDVATHLAQLAPDKIATLKASPQLSARLEALIGRKKDGVITPDETTELEQFLALDLFISLAKVRARFLLAE